MLPHKMTCIYANGTKAQNLKYCTKEEGRKSGPWIHGTCTEKKNGAQGKRTDLDDFVRDYLEEGGLTPELVEQYQGYAARYHKHVESLKGALALAVAKAEEKAYWQEQARKKAAGEEIEGQQQRKVVLFFGPTAMGKTTAVKLEVGKTDEDLYVKDGNNKWFCGYAQEENVLFDELRKEAFSGSLATFNAMTNKGACQVETKGGYTMLTADTLYFTSNTHPTDIWNTKWADGKYRAMARRHAEVHWWNDEGNYIVLENPGPEPMTEDEEVLEEWKKKNDDWVSFWKGRNRPIQEGDSAVPDQDEEYFTFGCNQ